MTLPPGPRAVPALRPRSAVPSRARRLARAVLGPTLVAVLLATGPAGATTPAEAGTAHRLGRLTLHLLERALEVADTIDPGRCLLRLLERLPPPPASYPRPAAPEPAEPQPVRAPAPAVWPAIQVSPRSAAWDGAATATAAIATAAARGGPAAAASRGAGIAPLPAITDPIWSMLIAIPLARRLVDFCEFIVDAWVAYAEAYRRDNPQPDRAPEDAARDSTLRTPALHTAPAEEVPCVPADSF